MNFEGQRHARELAANAAVARPHAGRHRFHCAALALSAMVVGLAVHRLNFALHPVARDMLGDALWAMMMFYGIGLLFPRTQMGTRIIVALAVCFGVEASQLYRNAWLDAVRATFLGHLIFGSGFDWRDFLSYSLGVTAAAVIMYFGVPRRV